MTSYTLEDITNNKVYLEALKDSFGGIMYNVANFGKYDSTELLKIWNSLTPGQRSSAGGIMKGALSFLEGRDS